MSHSYFLFGYNDLYKNTAFGNLVISENTQANESWHIDPSKCALAYN